MITSFQKKDKFKNPILFPQKRGSRKKRIKKYGRKDKHERKKEEEEEKISTKQKDKKSKLNDDDT